MDDKTLQRVYRNLFKIRRTEEAIIKIYPTDRIQSPVHLSIGQEAVSVGVCEALAPTDTVFGTYRSHALYLAKGCDLKKMMAELYGKYTGCAKGKGGSMHLVEAAHGLMATSAVVATTIPIAVGFAQAYKVRKEAHVAVVFFGDGAIDEGAFHESLNYSALKKLPILFVCENNLYAIHSHHLQRHHSDNIVERSRSYGIPAERIEGNDTLKIYERTQEIVAKMRTGSGPYFLECMTYRWKEHVGPNNDVALGYRTQGEIDSWMKEDQIEIIGKKLSAAVRNEIETQVQSEIQAAIKFAEESPEPPADSLFHDVYAEN